MEHLKAGDQTPYFKVLDTNGKVVESGAGGKRYFLSFHRFTTCPFCNLRTHELKQNYDNFKERDIEIVSIWPSSQQALFKDVQEKMNVPFSLVADEHLALYEKYGVNGSSKGTMKHLLREPLLMAKALKYVPVSGKIDGLPELLPANFLINTDGLIEIAHYGKHIGHHLAIKEISNLKTLQQS